MLKDKLSARALQSSSSWAAVPTPVYAALALKSADLEKLPTDQRSNFCLFDTTKTPALSACITMTLCLEPKRN